MITFDIKDLYTNIPIDETINIIKTKLQQNSNRQITHQITVLLQNYFIFQHKIYHPEQGMVMGSPISGIVAKILLQNYEDNYIKQFLESKNILYYTRYVDDIFYHIRRNQKKKTHKSSTHRSTKCTSTWNSHPHVKNITPLTISI